jgi:hypothetical protein
MLGGFHIPHPSESSKSFAPSDQVAISDAIAQSWLVVMVHVAMRSGRNFFLTDCDITRVGVVVTTGLG